MSEIEEIVNELKNIHDGNAWHGASLKDALDGINFEQAAAHPLRNAHSVWEIVAHVEGWEDVFRRRLEGQQSSEPEAGDFPLPAERDEKAWAESLKKLENTHQKLLLTIEKLSDSVLDTNIAGRDYSYRFLLRKTIDHKVYHSGQIALLKKSFPVKNKENKMIARIWHGTTRAERADEYVEYLNKTGIPDYRSTKGNRGAYILRRIEDGAAHFYTLTFWDSYDSIKLFAGEDYERARYYPEDEKFLLEFEPTVRHFEVFG